MSTPTGPSLTTGTTAGAAQPMAQGKNLNDIDDNQAGSTSRPVQGAGTKEPQDRAVGVKDEQQGSPNDERLSG